MIEHFTVQLKNSEWTWKEAKEIVISGYAGWIRKRRRREESGQDLYRSAAASLSARVRGKLTGKESWYKDRKRRRPDEFDDIKREKQPVMKRKIEEENRREERTSWG